jgi:peroxiredoxin
MNMNFKNTILASLVIIILSMGCDQPKVVSNYSVSGVIKNAPKEKLLLQELKFDGLGNKSRTIATTTTDENGKFDFSFTTQAEGLYNIVLEKENPKIFTLLFINDEKEIKINADKKNLEQIAVTGSKNTALLYNFLKEYNKKNESFILCCNNLETMQKINGAPFIIDSLQKDRFSKMNDLNNYVLNAISASSNPTFIQYALIQSYKRLPIATTQILEYASVAAEKTKSESLKNFATTLSNQINNSIAPTPIAIGQLAPEITLSDINGKIITLSSLRGKYVLVDFWASWCGPCRAENPNVVNAFEKYKDKNFTVLGVSLDEDKAAWSDAIQADKLNWQHVSDLKKWESIVASTYQLQYIPFNVLLDPNGIIIGIELTGNALQEKLASILK